MDRGLFQIKIDSFNKACICYREMYSGSHCEESHPGTVIRRVVLEHEDLTCEAIMHLV